MVRIKDAPGDAHDVSGGPTRDEPYDHGTSGRAQLMQDALDGLAARGLARGAFRAFVILF